ncbi:MAG: right-handed parallel beta-helix repeat-containing protein, partial [Candidatus Thorarchaeota archaeon]
MKESKNFVHSQYTNHDRIAITNNSHFTREGFTGSGTPEDPYVISSIAVDSQTDAISIQDTTAYFVIRDTQIISNTQGIYLYNVSNGIIENCIITSSTNSIYFHNSVNITIDSADVRTGNYGIRGENVAFSTIENSNVHHNRFGIYMNGESSMIDIQSCKIFSNSVLGIILQNETREITISYCDIGWNGVWDNGILTTNNIEDLSNITVWNSNRFSDYDGEGTHEIGNSIVINPIPLQDNLAPSVSGVDDMRLDEGDIGHQTIHWNASDEYISFYEIWMDGWVVEVGDFYGGQLIFDLEEIELGSHNFTAVFIDAAGNEASDEVWVSVLQDG